VAAGEDVFADEIGGGGVGCVALEWSGVLVCVCLLAKVCEILSLVLLD